MNKTGKIMYQELFKAFENVKNLGGKAWEHAVAIDLLNSSNIQDCSISIINKCLNVFLNIFWRRKASLVPTTTAFKTNKSKYRSGCV